MVFFFVYENRTRADAVFQPPLSFTSLSTEAKYSMLVSDPLRASFCWKEDICCKASLQPFLKCLKISIGVQFTHTMSK